MTRALGFDAWTVDCIPFIGEGTNCPEPAGPDFDFGQQFFRVPRAATADMAEPVVRRHHPAIGRVRAIVLEPRDFGVNRYY